MAQTLLVISAFSEAEIVERIAQGSSPRKDYLELARRLSATIMYRDAVYRHTLTRLIARLTGVPVAQALLAFRHRQHYDAVFTDAENIGLPLALLFKLARVRRRHVMLGHFLTTPWKRVCFRWLKLQSCIDVVVCHASRQRWLLELRLGVPADRIALLPYQVDVHFWQSTDLPLRRQVCSAGLEFRDYPTLIEAVRGLEVEVVIAAASHWSKRRNEAERATLPPNVRVTALGYSDLRTLYAQSLFVVLPLYDVEFQAGITTLLEAMAMGKAVVISQTRGQNDVVRDERGWPSALDAPAAGFGHLLADGTTSNLGQTGLYVPPGEVAALRRAIVHLLDHPADAAAMGANGRRLVERLMSLDQYVERLAALLETERGC